MQAKRKEQCLPCDWPEATTTTIAAATPASTAFLDCMVANIR